MCGLFGAISGTLSATEIERVRLLGAISFPRGVDSIGMGYVTRKGHKNTRYTFGRDVQVSDPWGYLYHPATVKFFNSLENPRVLMGHNRAATIGAVTKDNAHPYHIGNIIGAHNGTIRSLVKDGKEDRTDSYELYKKISEVGLEEALQSVPANQAAYALTYLDASSCTLNIIRNPDRPLWYMTNPSRTTLYWASEEAFLKFLKDRDASLTMYNEIRQFEVGKLYTFDITSYNPCTPKITDVQVEPIVVEMEDAHIDCSRVLTLAPPPANDLVKDKEEEQHKVESEETKTTVSNGVTSETKLQTLQWYHNIDMTPGRKSFNAHVDSSTYELDVIPAVDVSPKDSRGYQEHVENALIFCLDKDGVSTKTPQYRRLVYQRADGRLVSPDRMLQAVQKGCLFGKRVIPMDENLYWINSDEYIGEEHLNDDFLLEYMSSSDNYDSPMLGVLGYSTPRHIHEINRKITNTIKANKDK